MHMQLRLKAALLSLLMLFVLVGVWQIATAQRAAAPVADRKSVV